MELCQKISCCGAPCCKGGDVTDRLFRVGRDSLTREINVIKLVRSLRIVERFIEESLDKN